MTTPLCEKCSKSPELCICDTLQAVATRTKILILQHPQEPDKELGTARIAHLFLQNSALKVGLSWPNLARALGQPSVSNSQWGVLYLGSGATSGGAGSGATSGGDVKSLTAGLHWVNRKGQPLSREESQAIFKNLEGLVVLDGTWSQAKTLWWRNAWLLKLRRAILVPKRPSLYKELRREPRKECLSTIESISQALESLGEEPHVSQTLEAGFARLLDKQRARLRARSTRNVRG